MSQEIAIHALDVSGVVNHADGPPIDSPRDGAALSKMVQQHPGQRARVGRLQTQDHALGGDAGSGPGEVGDKALNLGLAR